MSGSTVMQADTTPHEATVTHEATAAHQDTASAGARGGTLTLGRAARELALKRTEFDIAVHLGRIRTVPDDGGGGRRVTRVEIDRLRAEEGFPEALRKSVEAVGTAEGAALMQVSIPRFTRLARLGLVVPVHFYLNRYRAVVWLYPAEELRRFAADLVGALDEARERRPAPHPAADAAARTPAAPTGERQKPSPQPQPQPQPHAQVKRRPVGLLDRLRRGNRREPVSR